MNPLRIRLRNVRTFRSLDLAFADGRFAILGANGAGKSTVATSIDWALFGPDARSWAPYLTQGVDEANLSIEFEFEHGDSEYRIRRGYSARGAGKSTLDLDRIATHGITLVDPLTRETVKETQALIESIVGLTRETFRASAMLVQGDGGAFTEAAPISRKQILARILGLERWTERLGLVRADLREVESSAQMLAGRIESLEDLTVGRDETVAEIEKAVAEASDAAVEGETAKRELDAAGAIVRRAGEIAAGRALRDGEARAGGGGPGSDPVCGSWPRTRPRPRAPGSRPRSPA